MLQAIEWQARRTAEEFIRERESMICAIEEAAAAMVKEGTCAAWFGAADQHVKDVAASVNGPIFASLLEKGEYVDAKCVESFREGNMVSQCMCLSFTLYLI